MTRKELALKWLSARGYRLTRTIAHYEVLEKPSNIPPSNPKYFLGRNGAVRSGSSITGSKSRTAFFERCIYGVDQG